MLIGGVVETEDLGDGSSMCNVYCGKGSAGEGKCSGNCGSCGDAGNGTGSGSGQDKMCQWP